MTYLDRSPQAGQEQTWLVVRLEPNDGDPEYRHPFVTTNVRVTAASMEVLDGGTLVFRSERGALSWAFGPGGWLEVSRA